MVKSSLLLAAAISLHAATPAPAAGPVLYRIELQGNQVVWSEDQPRESGALVLFHRSPDKLLVSVKKAEVRRIVLSRRGTASPIAARPVRGTIDLGPTGSAAAPVTQAGAPEEPPLGSRKDGTALLNPNRPYKPDWDTKQVPGLNLPYPNAPNDYREGRTFAYPPSSAVQEAPGEPPKAPPSSGEPPKGPS